MTMKSVFMQDKCSFSGYIYNLTIFFALGTTVVFTHNDQSRRTNYVLQ